MDLMVTQNADGLPPNTKFHNTVLAIDVHRQGWFPGRRRRCRPSGPCRGKSSVPQRWEATVLDAAQYGFDGLLWHPDHGCNHLAFTANNGSNRAHSCLKLYCRKMLQVYWDRVLGGLT